MKLNRNHIIILSVLIVLVAVYFLFFKKKKEESSFTVQKRDLKKEFRAISSMGGGMTFPY